MFNLLRFDIKSFFDKRVFIYEIDWGGWYEVDTYQEALEPISLDSIEIPDIVKPLLEDIELPEESMLMKNIIYSPSDSSTFTNMDYLEALFNDVLTGVYAWKCIITKNWSNEINIDALYWIKIKILKRHLNNDIIENSMIISLNKDWKLFTQKEKFYLKSLFQKLVDFDGFVFEYIDDNFKNHKHKELREILNFSFIGVLNKLQENKNILVMKDDSDWNSVIDEEVTQEENKKNEIKFITALLWYKLNSIASHHKSLINEWQILVESKKEIDKWNLLPESTRTHKAFSLLFSHNIENFKIEVQQAETTMHILKYIIWIEDLQNKFKVREEGWKMVLYEKDVWKIEKWFKDTTNSVKKIFNKTMWIFKK